MCENVVLQGSQFVLLPFTGQEKEWKVRYFVLYGPSSRMQPRIVWYESEEDYEKEPQKCRGVFIEQIQQIRAPQYGVNGREHVIELALTAERALTISAETHADSMKWRNAIHQLKGRCQRDVTARPNSTHIDSDSYLIARETGDEYKVDVVETDASRKNYLPKTGTIAIGTAGILFQTSDNQPLFEWPFKCIRRYGSGGDTFNLEAGRRSTTGAGVFMFRPVSRLNTELMEAVEQRIKKMGEAKKVTSDDEGRQEDNRLYEFVKLGTEANTSSDTTQYVDSDNSGLSGQNCQNLHRAPPPPIPPQDTHPPESDENDVIYESMADPSFNIGLSTGAARNISIDESGYMIMTFR